MIFARAGYDNGKVLNRMNASLNIERWGFRVGFYVEGIYPDR